MTLIGYKSRPRMRSWTAPEPPPPRRSGYLWFALLAWLGALVLGYRWVWPDPFAPFRSSEESTDVTTPPFLPNASLPPKTMAPLPPTYPPSAASQTSVVQAVESSAKPTTLPQDLPGCEAFRAESQNGDNLRMPAHLGQAAFGSFIGETAWLKPCRGKVRRVIKFCAAIRDGALVGLSLRAEPRNLTLENCVREQALKVPLRAEPSLTVMETHLTL